MMAPLFPRRSELPLHLALAAVLSGYFLPWLDHPTAGLTLIGLDISEWIKFLPQVQAGEFPSRDIFYLPPVVLGGIVVLLTAGRGRGDWRAWGQRGLGLLVALLAFPSVDAVRFEPAGEWRPRLVLIALVLTLIVVVALWRRPPLLGVRGLLVALALLGGGLPAWLLLQIKPAYESWLQLSISVGAGFWLTTAGFLAAAFILTFSIRLSGLSPSVGAGTQNPSGAPGASHREPH